jgi:predicted metal-dependent hydrolase
MIMIEYTLTRSNRKSVALYVRNGNVEVRAPLHMPKRDIDSFVASKEAWITNRLAKSREQSERRGAFALNYGDTVLYRGKEYPIAVKNGSRIGFDDTAFYMPPNLTPEQIKSACVQIYRMLAKRDLTAKTLGFAKQMNVMPAAVKINGARTRWGSCSGKKSINFSWRLIMADADVIDYVVVHELAHITEMNHSKKFWEIVEGVLPDYKMRQLRLRELQQRLNTEDWGE